MEMNSNMDTMDLNEYSSSNFKDFINSLNTTFLEDATCTAIRDKPQYKLPKTVNPAIIFAILGAFTLVVAVYIILYCLKAGNERDDDNNLCELENRQERVKKFKNVNKRNRRQIRRERKRRDEQNQDKQENDNDKKEVKDEMQEEKDEGAADNDTKVEETAASGNENEMKNTKVQGNVETEC